MYPNPNNGNFVIDAKEGSTVRILNSMGQEVASYTISDVEQRIELKDCKSGVYFLIISSNGKQSCQKFVIAN